MKRTKSFCKNLAAFLSALLVFASVPLSRAVVFDNDVDPARLGTGDWIYFMNQAADHLGGTAPSVTNVTSLMKFYRTQGVDFIAVKAGTGAEEFPPNAPQFTEQLVREAHAFGIKIFGYNRSDGKNVPGEIALAAKVYARGADGFIIDAEAEWESSRLGTNGPTLALQLGAGIKKLYPNKFLAHAPMPIISRHTSFPYKEFGLYCDAVMPQDYWKSIGVTPKRMVDWRELEFQDFYRTLTGVWTNAIKPIAPIAQGWNPTPDQVVTAAEILEYANALKTSTRAISPGGYKGVSYWRTDLHTARMWKGIRRADILSSVPVEFEPDEIQEQQLALRQNENGETGTDIILDNKSLHVTMEGRWQPGRMKPAHYGPNYEWIFGNVGKATASMTYRPTISRAGNYNVYVWYPAELDRSSVVQYLVTFDGGAEKVAIDQGKNGGHWVLLAKAKHFAEGTAGSVAFSNEVTKKDTTVVADAVRFQLCPDDAQQEAELINLTTAPAPVVINAPAPVATKTPAPAVTSAPAVVKSTNAPAVPTTNATVASSATKVAVPALTNAAAVATNKVVDPNDVVVTADSQNVLFHGKWNHVHANVNHFSETSRFSRSVNGAATAYAVFRPKITVAGTYDIYSWHTVSANRSHNVRFEVVSEDGSETTRVDQVVNGGKWVQIAANRNFNVGTNGYVKISNDTGDEEKTVVADAVRFALRKPARADNQLPSVTVPTSVPVQKPRVRLEFDGIGGDIAQRDRASR